MASIPSGEPPTLGSRLHGNDGRRRRTPQSSFPQQRESTAATSSFPRRRESTAGGRRWVPVSTGTTDGGGAPHNRHSHNSGNPRQPHRHSRDGGGHGGGPAMGSRLHGNDGRRRRTPQSSFPQRESTAATSVIPATAGIHGGGPAMGSRLHGNDGRRRAAQPHNRHSRDGGNPSPTWCTITTPEAVRHAVLPSQLVNLGRIGVVLAGCLPYA